MKKGSDMGLYMPTFCTAWVQIMDAARPHSSSPDKETHGTPLCQERHVIVIGHQHGKALRCTQVSAPVHQHEDV